MVEHPAVNRRVVGSSPTRGARENVWQTLKLFLLFEIVVGSAPKDHAPLAQSLARRASLKPEIAFRLSLSLSSRKYFSISLVFHLRRI